MQCNVGSEHYPDAHNLGLMHLINVLKHMEKLSVVSRIWLKTISYNHITQKDVVTSNVDPQNVPGYKLYFSDKRHHQKLSTPQSMKVVFDFRPVLPAATHFIGYAFLINKKLVSTSGDRQRQFDKIKKLGFRKIPILFHFQINFS